MSPATPTPAPKLSLHHRFRPAPKPTHGVTPLLILLHGYGSNEDDLLGLAPYLDPRFNIVSARAPDTLGPGSYAWFPVEWTAEGVKANPAHAQAAIDPLLTFVREAMTTYDAQPAHTLLLGFSQGATMSAGALLRKPDLVAGAVLMSGLAPAELATTDSALAGKPMLITHGVLDDVVPVRMSRVARDLLQSLGASVEYREYPMAHQISEACLEDVDRWLEARLG
jgi:phospholipase/carboxylesterase